MLSAGLPALMHVGVCAELLQGSVMGACMRAPSHNGTGACMRVWASLGMCAGVAGAGEGVRGGI
jgi:hypothetical protein